MNDMNRWSYEVSYKDELFGHKTYPGTKTEVLKAPFPIIGPSG